MIRWMILEGGTGLDTLTGDGTPTEGTIERLYRKGGLGIFVLNLSAIIFLINSKATTR